MKLNKTTLSFALAIQLAIIVVVMAARAGAVAEPEPFLSFDAQSVDSLSVANADGSVDLVKSGDAWQLPDGVPADADKVQEVLDKLDDVSGIWPVASSASTAERFEVTEDNHQRHLQLRAGDETLADIYLGTSPGYRKAHARHSDDDDIYAIGFSNYEAGVNASDWLDKSLLRPTGDIATLKREGAFELSKEESGNWVSADGAVLDQAKVETLAGRFSGLSVLGVSEAELPSEPTATFAIGDDDGTLAFTLYRMEDDDYAGASGRMPGVYELSSYIAEQMDVTLADLAPDEPEEEAEAEPADDGEPAAQEGTPPASDASEETSPTP